MVAFVAVSHARFLRVDPRIFTRTIAADCMTHACAMQPSADATPGPTRLDACCQYGADVDLSERDRIMARASELRALLRAEVRDRAWFTEEVTIDPEFPSGGNVRTVPVHDGCVFLQHDARGCAIHRAALENGWDFRGTKPHVCRLFPLTYEADAIVISDDYTDYTCAHLGATAPTLYQNGRDTLADVFGEALVVALDAVEATVQARQLPVAR